MLNADSLMTVENYTLLPYGSIGVPMDGCCLFTSFNYVFMCLTR